MNREFKKLLLKIAALPLGDQRWILDQLPNQQQEQFKQMQGYSGLIEAQKFRKLPYDVAIPNPVSTHIPKLGLELAKQSPLYIAVILEQATFSWGNELVQICEHKEEIKRLMQDVVLTLKPATKTYVFEQWQSQLDFIDQLESDLG